jgi:hypothetical protein
MLCRFYRQPSGFRLFSALSCFFVLSFYLTCPALNERGKTQQIDTLPRSQLLFCLFYYFPNYPTRWDNPCMAAKERRGGHNKTPRIKVDAVIRGLKQGKGINQLAVDLDIGRTTVGLIREQNRDVVPNWRRKTAQSMMELSSKLVAHLTDTYQDLPPHSKPILLGILSDKIRDLTSEGGQVVQHQHVHIDHGDINAMISGTKGTKQMPPRE